MECFICLEPGAVRVCNCAHAHPTCLERFLNTSSSTGTCAICRVPYVDVRPQRTRLHVDVVKLVVVLDLLFVLQCLIVLSLFFHPNVFAAYAGKGYGCTLVLQFAFIARLHWKLGCLRLSRQVTWTVTDESVRASSSPRHVSHVAVASVNGQTVRDPQTIFET